MTNRIPESSSQGDGGIPPSQAAGQPDNSRSRAGNTVFKSGPLFISSKGIGWTSWKKRWFILTRTSLVFFRSDPSAIPQKGSEVNLTLGGIDLNNSGSVVVKADKKLLTVLFPDGRDGRAFTLKAETSEDLYEWKAALENALAQAPSAALGMGQNGIFKKDQADAVDGSVEQLKDKQPVKSKVIGRPILLALEDADGAPSFLEKALRFIEEHGVKVEGILRQAADVDDVEHRIREYEQGKKEFSAEEDAHIIADCVKYVLRELPSSPVPASCCNALVEACRTDRSVRVNAMREAICETFPEPNRRLLQRILMMMQTVASHKTENRMSVSAVAACMAPLLLRPLLAGECELDNDFDVGGDGSIQLLKAAAAANHAQAIAITLLEEYDKIFGEDSISPDIYSNTDESGNESEEATDDDESYEDDDYDDGTQESDADIDDDLENASNGTCSESGDSRENDMYDDKGYCSSGTGSKRPGAGDESKSGQKLPSSSIITSRPPHDDARRSENIPDQNDYSLATRDNEATELSDVSTETSLLDNLPGHCPAPIIKKSSTISNGPVHSVRPPTVWGRTPAKKNLSMESIDYGTEDEVEIDRLEATKIDLQNRIAEEAKENAVLQASLEDRKKVVQERRLALEQEVARLQEQLQKERDLRTTLEVGLKMSQGPLPVSTTIDEKTKANLEEIALAEADTINLRQKVDDLGQQLNQQREQTYGSMHDMSNQPQQTPINQAKLKNKQKDTTEATTTQPTERSARSKNTNLDGSEGRKKDSTPLPNKNTPQNPQLDSAHSRNFRAVVMQASASSAESGVSRPPAPSNSKKSGTKGEQGATTTSALTKLTTRLNFLKERRSQIANELQNLDKGRASGQSNQNPDKGRGSEQRQPIQNPDKSQGSEGQGLQSPGKGRGSDSSQSLQNQDKGPGTEGQSLNKSGKF